LNGAFTNLPIANDHGWSITDTALETPATLQVSQTDRIASLIP
jgi:hypothetical protein